MPVKKTITFDGNCDCYGEAEYLVTGWNDLDKPTVRCLECDETTVGPLGAARVQPEGSHRAAHIAADGGRSR